MRNDQIFPSKVCHFQYDHRFLFSREIGNVGKNLLNSDCQDSFRFGMFQAAYKWGKSFGKIIFSFPFSVKCFDRNLKCIF